jgi:hypothetical protein
LEKATPQRTMRRRVVMRLRIVLIS